MPATIEAVRACHARRDLLGLRDVYGVYEEPAI
jgi:hypothetical protein